MLGASREVVGWRGSFVRTGVQFVAIAHPRKTGWFDVIECYKVVISWQAVNGLYADLVEALEEVLESHEQRRIHMEDGLTSATSMGFLSSCVLRSFAMVNWYCSEVWRGKAMVWLFRLSDATSYVLFASKANYDDWYSCALVRTRQSYQLTSDHGVTRPVDHWGPR
jgi:hypothetical protein